ncbi:hypothetical protein KAU51_04705 [Candidatus Parcubacteria bacterium]|nr:hypothetical protein [Candidatus Parcubacteria bacterium]
MPIRNSDIRLIDGNITSTAKEVKEYLSHIGFKVEQEKIKQSKVVIETSNQQRSVIKLYLSTSPQIIRWHLEQKSDEQVQIEIECDLFKKFKLFYYTCFCTLLIGCTFLLLLGFSVTSSNKIIEFYSSAKLLTTGLFFYILSVAFFFKMNAFSVQAGIFLKNFYTTLTTKGFVNEILIQDNINFPELKKSAVLFLLPVVSELAFIIIENFEGNYRIPVSLYGLFLYGLVFLIVVLIVLVIIMTWRPAISKRFIFLVVGVEMCLPFAVYTNVPIVFVNFVSDNIGDAKFIIERLENPSEIEVENLQRAFFNIPELKKDVYNVILMIPSFLFFVLFITFLFLKSTISLPIKVARNLNRFKSIHKESLYYKALESGNSSILFNSVVFILWQLITVANIIGVFFAFSIFENALIKTNLVFKSVFVDQFFYNIKIISSILLSIDYHFYNEMIFQRMIMLLYSLPAILIVFFVLRKNIKSMMERYSLLKKKSNHHEKIEKQLAEKVKGICKFINIQTPIIRVIDSPNIDAKTKYLDFPIFKNILVIPEGTWNELYDNEDELDALLAHEIWHIKKHTFLRRLLCVLSDYSLFGNGFLAMFQNSYRIEKEADEFAVRWLIENHQEKNKAVSFLRSLLERIEEVNWKNVFLQPKDAFNFSMLKEDSYRDGLVKRYDNSSKVERIKINLKLLYQMYFGEEILSYFHPSINQRIAWIQEKYGTHETN